MNGGIFIHILILGQDPRFSILEYELKKRHNVDISCDINIDILKYNIIILPMKGITDDNVIELLKGSKEDVVIYTGLKNNLENLNRKVISFFDDNKIKEENDNLTVAGIIDYIKDIKHDKICLLGYGHIGKKLFQLLKEKIWSIGIIEKRDKQELGSIAFYTTDKKIMEEKLSESDLIINTVPNNIITEEVCNNLKTPILDIASKPYGISREIVDKYHLNYYLYSGIPGKYDPIRAGKILLKKFN